LRPEREAAKVLARWGILVVALVGAAAIAVRPPVLHAAAHAVEVAIVGNKSAGGGFAFNGYQRGGMTLTVPVGWQVVVHFENDDTTPHSAAVVASGGHTQVTPPSTPAFAGATTPNFSSGLPKGGQATFSFEASKAGTYEFVCGVPGHAISGQWDALVVSATADAPSVTPPGAATLTVK
jgi:sulfocyanin